MALVVSERAVIVGGAVVIGLMVTVVGWNQLTAPPRSTSTRSVAVLGQEKIQTISTGDEVDLDAHLPATGRTVVEFSAEW